MIGAAFYLSLLVPGTSYLQATPEHVLLENLKRAVSSGNTTLIEPLFARKADAAYLLTMGSRNGGLRSLKVNVIPSPPGWTGDAPFWAIIHTNQEIESDHDIVYGVTKTADGLRLGSEIPEWVNGKLKPAHAGLDVSVQAQTGSVQVRAAIDVVPNLAGNNGATVWRLGDRFKLNSVLIDGKKATTVEATDERVPRVDPGQVLRAGSLMVVWGTKPYSKIETTYQGVVRAGEGDTIDEKRCYLTAWWVPTVSRLPFTTVTRIRAPRGWIVTSEGDRIDPYQTGMPPAGEVSSGEQLTAYRCDIAISYPKVVGGTYVLAAERQDGKRTFRSFQFDPVDKSRATKDAQRMAEAAKFYDSLLGPFPFNFYHCFDADTYYGIESYSYTLLQKDITPWAVSHEMGHTYFGGIVPNTYTQDCWNESMTQYVDSVLFLKNQDRTLQSGLATMRIPVPLSKMSVPHEYNSATYMRGAYVLRMLENEIGMAAMSRALRSIVKDRAGVPTIWKDLRAPFETAASKPLDWFWSQWIDGASFPNLNLKSAQIVKIENKSRIFVTVDQGSGLNPFRLKFKLRLSNRDRSIDQVVSMFAPSQVFQFDLDWAPTKVEIDVFEYSLATTGGPIEVRT